MGSEVVEVSGTALREVEPTVRGTSTAQPCPARQARLRGGARAAGLLAIVVATALWGFGGTMASRLFEVGIQPLELVEARTLITFAGLAALVALARRRLGERPNPRSWPLLVAFGVAVAAANASLFLAISHLPVAVAMVLQNLAPAFVLGWLLVVQRRPPRLFVIFGMLLAIGGVALLVRLPTTPLLEVNLLGVAFGLATAAAVAAFSVLGSRATQQFGALRANMYAFGVSSVLWLLARAPAGVPEIIGRIDQLTGVLVVGMFGTLLPFALFAWGTARIGAQAGAVNISLEPAFAGVLAWLWLGQQLDAMQIIGGVLLITAVVYLQRDVDPDREPNGIATESIRWKPSRDRRGVPWRYGSWDRWRSSRRARATGLLASECRSS